MSVAVLLQLADGRFPAGGHAHSGGTEPACGVGDVIDVASLRSYVEGRLATSGRVDASFSASACALVARGASADDWRELDAELAARTLSPAARRAGRTLGRQLLRAGGRVWPHPCLAVVRAAVADGVLQPVALGAVAGAAGLAPIDAAICTLHHLLTGITSAALRLLGLDPFEIARLHGDVAGVIDTLAADAEATSRAAASPAGLPADVGLLADILAEHHTTWDVRLFASLTLTRSRQNQSAGRSFPADGPGGTTEIMVSDDAPNPSALAVADEQARRLRRSEQATSTLDWLFEHDFLGPHATAAIIGLVTDDRTLTLLSAVGDLPVIERDDPVAVPLIGDAPLCRAARLGIATCITTPDEIRRSSPWLALVAPSARSAVTFPIRAAGRTIGAIGVTYSEPTTDGEQLLERVMLIGESLGSTLRNLVLPATAEEPQDRGGDV